MPESWLDAKVREALAWTSCPICSKAMGCKELCELAGAVWTGCCGSCHVDETDFDIQMHAAMMPCGHEREMCCEALGAVEKVREARARSLGILKDKE